MSDWVQYRDRPALSTCLRCAVRTRGLCAPWSDEELAQLAAIKAPSRSLPAQADLFRQGEPLPDYLIVVEGWVALRVMLEDGSWHIPDLALPGTLLRPPVKPGAYMACSAITLTPVTVCPLPRARLESLAGCRAQLAMRMAHLAACREARLQDHFVNISGRAARERVAHLLVELFHRVHHRLPHAVGDSARFPLTLAQIGEMLNLTDVHVSRSLGYLRDQGVVHFFRHRMVVMDPVALLRSAGGAGEFAMFRDDAPGPTPTALRAPDPA